MIEIKRFKVVANNDTRDALFGMNIEAIPEIKGISTSSNNIEGVI